MSVDSQVKEDRPPHARFQRRAVENEVRSKEEGHYVGEDVDYVTVTAPYSNGKESVDYRVDKWFGKLEQHVKIGKFKPEWLQKIKAQYEAWKQGTELPVDGMPVLGWGMISPAQQQTLISMSIRTVEEVADMTEDSCRRFGMGGLIIKQRAQAVLKAARDGGKLAMENADLRSKLDLAEANVDKLQSDLKELAAYVRANMPQEAAEPDAAIGASDLIDEPEKPRRGRPPKG